MPRAKTEINYEALKAELDAILADLQRDDLDVDTALRSYQRGLELTRQLETYLKTAENKVSELKAKFDTGKA
jgi:exodeoxyribonuclease VII small subunit